MTWFRLPLFVWAIYATSLIMSWPRPCSPSRSLLVGLERLLRIGIFDPSLGGDPSSSSISSGSIPIPPSTS